MIDVFEMIANDPAKMAYYKENPIREATFMAFYAYAKAGLSFSDLPWFSLSKANAMKKNQKKVA